MKEYIIEAPDEGQTLQKYLEKALPGAKGAVLFKALRKKNIVLNGKKCGGKEILKAADSIKVFFSDEVIEKFEPRKKQAETQRKVKKEELKSFKRDIVYEDDNILIINKDAGLLSQSDDSPDISANDLLLKYLEDSVRGYAVKPSVCNRLDRNTSGLLLCGRTQKGLKCLSQILKDRSLKKYYYAIVDGEVRKPLKLKGYLKKDRSENRVRIFDTEEPDSDPVETEAEPEGKINIGGRILTLLYVHLITGKPHQIRAHMLKAGFPVLGDRKYCTEESLKASEELKADRQMLHAFKVEFPEIKGELSYLSHKVFEAGIKDDMNYFLKFRVTAKNSHLQNRR